jgi:hypothetical protein
MDNQKIIEAEAESVPEARKIINSQIPKKLNLISEEIISDGLPKTVEAVANTIQEAFIKAQEGIPPGANILERKEVAVPCQKVVIVEAFDEQNANAVAMQGIENKATIKAIRLTVSGKPGFLGMGKKPNRYEAELFYKAVVTITYKTRAKISAKIGKTILEPWQLQEEDDLIKEFKRWGVSDGDAFARLFVAKQAVGSLSQEDIQKIYNLDKDHDPYTLDDLALRWVVYRLKRKQEIDKLFQ